MAPYRVVVRSPELPRDYRCRAFRERESFEVKGLGFGVKGLGFGFGVKGGRFWALELRVYGLGILGLAFHEVRIGAI